jgi:hypothetical protein
MNHVSMVVDVNDYAGDWMWNHYSHYLLPTNYFDGGETVIVGFDTIDEFYNAIENSGQRSVITLNLQLSVEYLGDAKLGIDVLLKQGITCTDSDNDGYGDPGYPEDDCGIDNCPDIPNMSQEDMDSDGIGDPCDPDIDGDAFDNENDNCPMIYNPAQGDSDGDLVGDECDNCPDVYNTYQYDEDGDGTGDACDEDILYIQCCLDMPPAYLGVPFDYQLWTINGVAPYTWTKVLGQWPWGLLMTSEGELYGTPGYIATSTVKVVVEDAQGQTDTAWVTIDVTEEPEPEYVCGDADGSLDVDIDDAVYLISYIFAAGPAPDPLESGDADCSGEADIDDVVYLIAYIFSGGNSPCDTDGNGLPDC